MKSVVIYSNTAKHQKRNHLGHFVVFGEGVLVHHLEVDPP